MTHRYITGNLAEDPVVRQAGKVQIVKLTVLENTATYRGTERIAGHQPLRHIVEAKFELGANIVASLHKGNPVIVVGYERDASFEGKDGTVYGHIIDAAHVGPDLAHATAVVTRTASKDTDTGPQFTPTDEAPPAPEEPADGGSLWAQNG